MPITIRALNEDGSYIAQSCTFLGVETHWRFLLFHNEITFLRMFIAVPGSPSGICGNKLGKEPRVATLILGCSTLLLMGTLVLMHFW